MKGGPFERGGQGGGCQPTCTAHGVHQFDHATITTMSMLQGNVQLHRTINSQLHRTINSRHQGMVDCIP